MCTVCRRWSPRVASASAIRARARRMALPTATRARSGWSGKDLMRPPQPRGAGQLGEEPVSFARERRRPGRRPGLAGQARRRGPSGGSGTRGSRRRPARVGRAGVGGGRRARRARPPGRRPGSPGADWRSARPGGPSRCCPPPGRSGPARSGATFGRPGGTARMRLSPRRRARPPGTGIPRRRRLAGRRLRFTSRGVGVPRLRRGAGTPPPAAAWRRPSRASAQGPGCA